MSKKKTVAFKTVSYELGQLPRYGSLADIVKFTEEMRAFDGEKIVDMVAYENLKRRLGLPTKFVRTEYDYPDVAEQCTFTVTSEMINRGIIDQIPHRYDDGEYTAFIIYRPQFQFEIDIDLERKRELEEAQRKQFEELKKKFEGK